MFRWAACCTTPGNRSSSGWTRTQSSTWTFPAEPSLIAINLRRYTSTTVWKMPRAPSTASRDTPSPEKWVSVPYLSIFFPCTQSYILHKCVTYLCNYTTDKVKVLVTDTLMGLLNWDCGDATPYNANGGHWLSYTVVTKTVADPMLQCVVLQRALTYLWKS